MNTSKPIQIFKPGKHIANNGASLAFSETDLQATISAYDPGKHEAPLVIGHPKLDGPAYGWVKSLSFADGALVAEPDQVDAEFSELVNSGKFKKVSASFYTPDSPSNPVPGVYYLRHVGFLGAQPPAVKGMKSASFADGETGIVEFSGYDDITIAKLFRRLREWIIGTSGADTADKVLPDWELSSIELAAQEEILEDRMESSNSTNQFNEKDQGDAMSVEEKARLAALEAENATLKAENESFAEREKSQALANTKAANVSFAEGLIKSGKLLPASKDATVALLDSLSAATDAVEFGEGESKATKTPLDIYKTQLEAAPVLVNFGESASNKDANDHAVNFSAPAGFSVDAESLELHQKTVQYAEANKVSYEEALTKVGK